jgi:putative two-component system response regulator
MTAQSQSPEPASPRGTILVVEDDAQMTRLLTRFLESERHVVTAVHDGEAALASIAASPPDVILLDVFLPTINGFEICHILKENPATRLIPIVLMTGFNAPEHRIAGMNAGADDFLSKPFDPQELKTRVRSLVRLRRYTNELESAESVILSLALTIEARDAYTDGHCQRLARYATALGAAIGLEADALAALQRGGYLHDVGKVGVPDAVLLKPERLTAGEYEIMKQHTVIGDTLCGNLRSLAAVRPIIRHHHERLDGSGYPDGLRGDAIPLVAQIVSIVDAFDAMTTSRPYRPALTTEHACVELTDDARHGKLNADLVTTFVDLVRGGQLFA